MGSLAGAEDGTLMERELTIGRIMARNTKMKQDTNFPMQVE
jgi:hypothetical protein